MITIIRAEDRFTNVLDTMTMHCLFSFGDFFEAENVCFGDILVFNEYYVQPGGGFGMHPHENFEIVLVHLHGKTLFQDCFGVEIVAVPGNVIRISAGTGQAHKTINVGDEPSRYLAIWMRPKMEGLAPSCDSRTFTPQCWRNTLFTLVSDTQPPLLDTDSNNLVFNARGAISRCELTRTGMDIPLPEDGAALLYTLDGELTLNDEILRPGDYARIHSEPSIRVHGGTKADFLLIATMESP